MSDSLKTALPRGNNAANAIAIAILSAAALSAIAQSPTTRSPAEAPGGGLNVGDFAAAPDGTLPSGWLPLKLRGISTETRYQPVADPEHRQVVMATSNASASALIRKVDVDATKYPILRWQWKIDNLITGADITRREGDDYPARIYVSFRYVPERASFATRAQYAAMRLFYGEYPPHSGLNYVWDGKAPAGTVVPNSHTGRVAMIVVDSGDAHVRQWRTHQRNIVDDYRRAFGEDPPPISGIAIMTDTDNTGENARAWYGNISLQSTLSAPR